MAETNQAIMPRHVAVIMDGNGTYANQRNQLRAWGHKKGADNAIEILRHAVSLKLEVLTLWGFSTENWKRPGYEIKALFGLFEQFAVREADKLDEANIRVTFDGRRDGLPERLQQVMAQVEERAAGNTGLYLRPAINFSGIQQMVDAANRLLQKGLAITDENIREEIWGNTPPYDLVIRTAGHRRTSDFPVGHAEIFYSDKLWPEFTIEDFDSALDWFRKQDRRFGAVSKMA